MATPNEITSVMVLNPEETPYRLSNSRTGGGSPTLLNLNY